MRELDDEARWAGRTRHQGPPGHRQNNDSLPETRFTRRELNQLLNVYGRKVAAGEWRDYAIDHTRDRAVFSVFRRTAEMPLYRIVKQPRLARKQGTYAVVMPTGLIAKRGHELGQILRFLDSPLRVVA